MGKWGDGEIQLKPQNPKTPTLNTQNPNTHLPIPFN